MLPEEFKLRMKKILQDDYEDFIAALENDDAVKGVRVNRIKCKDGILPTSFQSHLTPLSYLSNGYILDTDAHLGASPEHHAGMIYSQDPGAMATACAVDVKDDFWVADLCAAPGGKSTQIAERLSEDGFLLCNEYVPKRAKILVGNLERMGVKNALVTSLDTSALSDMFEAAFDLVITDAPCSGEGMFRKSSDAQDMWSVDNILLCKQRQAQILKNASSMVKSDGYLLYSTCTYSIEENEAAVSEFLSSHPDFSLVEVNERLKGATRDGITEGFPKEHNLQFCRRFYPHVNPGEGQFLALMKRNAPNAQRRISFKDAAKPLSREELSAVTKFFEESLISPPRARLAKLGENPILIPHGCPIPPRSVFMPGVLLGEIRAGILRPSHQFFSCYGDLFKIKIELAEDDTRVKSYLLGEEINIDDARRGWCAVRYEGVSLGGGKLSSGTVKNHYPKGLRNTSGSK